MSYYCAFAQYYIILYLWFIYLFIIFYSTVGHKQRSPLGVQLFGTFVLFPSRQAAADRLSGNPAMSRDENGHRRTIDRAGK